MVDRSKKPSALAATPGPLPQPQVNTTHNESRVSAILPTGESCEILLYGATVVSWKDSKGGEQLWLSDAAKLDGSKPVRGGIPLVFPLFGPSPPDHPATAALPQHGFARSSRWEYLGKSTSESSAKEDARADDSSVKLDFGLSHSNLDEASKKAWPFDFGLIYSVTLSTEGLENSIVVRNEGTEAWDFQVLFHTYFRIKDINKVSISGLAKSKYIDKVGGITTKMETADELSIPGETDRVYTPIGGPKQPLRVSEGGKKFFDITRDNLESIVIWNPWSEKVKGMGDFEPKDSFKEMICIEAGQVDGWSKLDPGEAFEGSQFIKSLL